MSHWFEQELPKVGSKEWGWAKETPRKWSMLAHDVKYTVKAAMGVVTCSMVYVNTGSGKVEEMLYTANTIAVVHGDFPHHIRLGRRVCEHREKERRRQFAQLLRLSKDMEPHDWGSVFQDVRIDTYCECGAILPVVAWQRNVLVCPLCARVYVPSQDGGTPDLLYTGLGAIPDCTGYEYTRPFPSKVVYANRGKYQYLLGTDMKNKFYVRLWFENKSWAYTAINFVDACVHYRLLDKCSESGMDVVSTSLLHGFKDVGNYHLWEK